MSLFTVIHGGKKKKKNSNRGLFLPSDPGQNEPFIALKASGSRIQGGFFFFQGTEACFLREQ